jgi:acetyl-CoA C-acetyltransferase
MGPVSASRKALERAGWKPQDLDLLEINQVQVLHIQLEVLL